MGRPDVRVRLHRRRATCVAEQPLAKYQIEIDCELCIGDQLCCTEAPEVFELNDDGIAIVKDPSGDPAEFVKQAAESCPVDAITLTDSASGNRVWPPG